MNETKNTYVTAIIVAAGGSTRMGGTVSKQLLPLQGRPVIAYTLEAFDAAECIQELVVVCRPQEKSVLEQLARTLPVRKRVTFAQGGNTRQQSVFHGISAAVPHTTHYAIHDGARALITPDGICSVTQDGVRHGAATAAVPVKDTIKTADPHGFVTGTPERSALWSIQTPQVFERTLYLQAMERAVQEQADYTDDCQLVEQLGAPVHLCMGSYENIKLTTVEDIAVAGQIIKRREEALA